jgi:hypothetical protein
MIPPADPEKYKLIRDAEDWANPYVIVNKDGLELISRATSPTRRTIPTAKLRESLLRLPLKAWEYGRVVAVQEASIRSSDAIESKLIEQNKAHVAKVLQSLGVRIEYWPSA